MRGLFNDKIGSRLQVALFVLFYRNFQTILPPPYFDPTSYLILPNVPTLTRTPSLFGTQECVKSIDNDVTHRQIFTIKKDTYKLILKMIAT